MERGKNIRIIVLAVLLCGCLIALSGIPVMAAPLINLSPNSGAVGTLVTISGENWESFKGDEVYIFFDNGEISASPIVVPQTGSFQLSFNIPKSTAGAHTIRVKNEMGSTLALNTFTVIGPEIKLSAKSGPVGRNLSVVGKGFYADKVVTIYFDAKVLGTLTASTTGEFSYSFNIPDSTAGAHVIMASNAEGNSHEVEYEVLPWIALSPVTGAVGSIAQVSGNGFASRSDVSVFFQSKEVAYAKTNESGTFTPVSFNVPKALPGTYDVLAKDKKGNAAKYEFTITAGASVDQTMASVGGELTIRGTGFSAGGQIAIAYDGAAVATITADSTGAFEAIFKVPAGEHGEHVITVSDGVNTSQIVFQIESEPPPVPVPVSPDNLSVVKAATHFDWADVSDPSLPVSYLLQIASDGNFTSVVVQKTLAESEYTLSGAEVLTAVTEKSPYYWRVKAIDGAANESGWSPSRSFFILAPPSPGLLLPEDGAKAEAQVYFDWEDVTSLSPPITYRLQVASGGNFAKLVLEREGLAESEYTVMQDEKLAAVKKDAPYYWRVRAIDGAGNKSEWSKPRSFYVGFYLALPGWALYTLIALGAIIIGFLAFWLGRRTAFGES